ncbi:hypothetical protein [Streptomyces sp. NPDC020965]|uniref:DUF7927 domain-containing protein n=1 Tax=Streptomyces sp. NPDC020965 TaxID=3365105 RepID=UPI00379FD314
MTISLRGRPPGALSVRSPGRLLLVLGVLAQLGTAALGSTAVAAAPEPKTAPAVSARVPAACLPGFGYVLSGGDGSVQEVNLSTGVRSAIGTFTGIAPNLNAMDISPGGLSAWALSPPAASGSPYNVYRLDLATNTTQAFPGVVQPPGVGAILRGAINPVNGWYYYSGSLNSSSAQAIYAFDTVNNVSVGQVGTLNYPTGGGSGDMAFDSAGNLYMLISGGTTSVLVRINQTLPTTAVNMLLTGSLLSTLPPSASGTAYGGVMFGADGYLYVTVNEGAAGVLSKIDPNTGALVSSVNMSVPGGTPSGVADAGNCSFTGSLTAQKNIVGRVNPGDQFQVSVTGNGIGSGNIGTTTGTDTGLQTAVGETTTVPAVVGQTYTFTETGAGGTNLADYTTTYSCVDTAHNNAPIASGNGTSVQVTQPASPDANGVQTTCTFTNFPGAATDLALAKTAAPAAYSPSQPLTYTITVTNNGPRDSTGYTVMDTLPAALVNPSTSTPGCTITAGVLNCTGAALANGAATTITVTGTAGPGTTPITNTATVTGDDPDPNPNNNTDTTTTPPASVDLAVTKTGPAMVDVNGNVSYTITVTNNGPNDSTGWTLTDPIPAGLNGAATTTVGCTVAGGNLTCTGGPLANGASTNITLTGTAAPGTTTIVNTATVDGDDPDPNPNNNTSTTTTNVTPEADLAVDKSGPATVAAGGAVSYTITVTNNGPSASTGWTLTDPIPAGLTNAATTTAGCTVAGGNLTCDGGPLANGASFNIALTGNAAPGATTIVNTATVTGDDPDPNPNNNQDTTTTNVGRSVDLSVAKTGPATVTLGGEITYTIVITNNGPGASSGWTLTDSIPAQLTGASTQSPGCGIGASTLTCTGGPLANGASVTITVTGTAAANATTLTNTATVKGDDPDPTPGNNTSTTTTKISKLEITKKQNGPATVKAGEEVEYTITVKNTGTAAYTEANPATFSDDLTELLDDARYNNDATATRGDVSYSEPVLEWSGALALGQTATITFSLTTNARPFGDLKLDNTVASDTPGSNCPAGGSEAPGKTDARCTTKGKVDVKDKDKDRPRAALTS